MSAERSASAPVAAAPAAPAAPVSERTAITVLGTMLLLIVALTALLVQSTWADVRLSTQDQPAAPAGNIAQR